MREIKVLEQHIAVFGESGSGKTVMLSSFYGGTQEASFLQKSLFDVTADSTGEGHRLHSNYLGMRDSAQRPAANKLQSTSYSFSLKLKNQDSNAKQFDALRLVWHDYPGEWFEQDVSGAEEARRRSDTFKALLGSDVALLLVDGQRLLDNAGEEERYLKSVLASFRTGLLRLRDELLEDGNPLVKFPRIWIVALSKADVLPELDVFGFRDLIIKKAVDDLDELRRVLQGFVQDPEALSVGEDFMLLSSAKFEPNVIKVNERIGLDLILPIAAMVPFERHVKWAAQKQLGTKVLAELLGGAGALAAAMLGKGKGAGLVGKLAKLAVVTAAMKAAVQLAGDKLKEKHDEARANHNDMAAVLTGFRLDLEKGEEEQVLLLSKK
jgi:hypothetical protein